MALSYDKLKAAFGKRNAPTENTGFWDKFYPFYKMNFDEVATFRFLPDLDEENPLGFVVENRYHELLINGKKVKVGCLREHDKDDTYCPMCAASQRYYNELGDEDMGKKFWRKMDYIAQGLIVHSPFDYPIKADENPVRLISIGPKLFKKIETAVISGDFDNSPYDLIEGTDFRIMKTKQGEYADYSNSEFARRSTAVSEDNLARMKLLNLRDFRYARKSVEQMEAMVEAFVTGKALADEKPASTDTPKDVPTVAAAAPAQTSSPAPAPAAAAPAEAAASGSSRAQEILARLRRDKANG